MEEKQVYTLQEIAEWGAKKDFLPQVQRGFVWRPSQIENLWDSLLRGYPVGAFVLSPKKNKDSFEMLDGQQRATAICLGFGKETFRDSQDNIKVFIDLKKPSGDNRKYLFRVITKSHPWGYQKRDNTKTLTSDNIRKAMIRYGVEDHLDIKLTLESFYPFDALMPIPFNFFIEAARKNENENLEVKRLEKKIREWQLEKKADDSMKENEANSGSDELYKISEIFYAVKNMLGKQKIPALYLDLEQFNKEEDDTLPNESDNDELREQNENIDQPGDNENTDDPIENLFIRLNSGGTPLRGEELNYSILKAKINTDLQKNIETACKGFLKPSRFITIAYRLYQHEKKEESSDALIMRIKPKQFQKTISGENYPELEYFLIGVLTHKKYAGKTLLEYARCLLEYDENTNIYGLPYLIMFKIADTAPEVMFLFLYRLMRKDKFKLGTDHHRRMIGMMTLFIWLGKGKNRDHSKLLSNVWPSASSKAFQQEEFWSSSTVQRGMINEVLVPIPKFIVLDKIKEYEPRINSNVGTEFDKIGYKNFIYKMFFNSDLIQYAQRSFLSKIFKEEQYHLDDTNTPFDWDHISPNRFVRRKNGIPSTIKEWYSSNGNYRAWPYSLNRIDQDDVPAKKLDPWNESNYEQDSIEDLKKIKDIKDKWKGFMDKNGSLFPVPFRTSEPLKNQLLKWSFCHKGWANCECEDMKKDWKEVYHLIMKRNLSICKEWYDNLKINDLVPEKIQNDNIKQNFRSKLDLRKWRLNRAEDKELKKNYDDDEVWVSDSIDGTLSVFFTYSKDSTEILNENWIVFGIYEKIQGGFIKSIKIPKKDSTNNYSQYDQQRVIQGNFTLISHDQDSYKILLCEFDKWLQEFPNKEIKALSKSFRNSIRI